MRSVLNFAVVGCGAMARGQHLPNLARSSVARLHTCCDADESALKQCRELFSPQKITSDFRAAAADPEVDVICLATTEKLRRPVIEAAAEFGKPIFVEKPIAPTLAEAYEVQRIVRESKISFCVGHNRRCSPAMIDAHAMFRRHMTEPRPCPWRWDRERASRPKLKEDGVAGMVVRINDDWWSWKGWAFDKKQAIYGPMLFEMTHFTDMCNWFLGAEPDEVTAVESGLLNHATIIRYKTGELATIAMAENGTFGYPKELYEMMGNGGIVAVDHMVEVRTAGIDGAPAKITYAMNNDRHPEVGREGGIVGWLEKKRAACEESAAKGDPMLQFSAEPDKGHAAMLDRFVAQIQGTGAVVCGVDDALLATRVAFAAIKSAQEKRTVRMEEV